MKKWILIGGLLFSSASAFANDAGCGLGSLIIRSNTKLLQLFAMTTNGSFSSQPLGITTGTSNCSASGLVMQDKAIQYYVEVNHQDLTREMAQGEGEKLRTLASLYGCEGTLVSEFGRMTQSSFEKIVPREQVGIQEIVTNLDREFQATGPLAQGCHRAI